jgi:hypothetical protein
LLVEKGIFTKEEFLNVVRMVDRERKRKRKAKSSVDMEIG